MFTGEKNGKGTAMTSTRDDSGQFYSELSNYYDGLFSVEPEEMAFIAGRIKGLSPVLDVGCGTGNRTEHLCAGRSRIIGIDLDAGMIERAREAHARDCIRYEVMDMAAIGGAFAGERFGAILCLGNTLVHLDSPEAVADFCRTVYGLLEQGGLFVIQILNYDRILRNTVGSLPALESPEAVFTRRYAWEGGRMHFITELRVKATGLTVPGDAVLYPLRRHELDAALRNAGFSATEYYGSYAGGPPHDDSFVTIAICRKA